jgi:EAL domain-containing protein (putative c-di-GMP-specific phosphodiesterase class I)
MGGNFHGVFIGINHYVDERNLHPLRYAEKDAQDMKAVFTDTEIGFPVLGTVDLLCGEKATKHNIEGTLHNVLIKNCRPEDTIVVYYSGHGFFTGESRTAYIGTYDTNLADIAFNPYAGLQMEDIYNKLFQLSPAARILFILDCCHSEAFIPPTKSVETSKAPRDLIDNTTFPQAEGRVAIFSSPSEMQSNESDAFKNGIFTHYMIMGLQGAAAENETGEVTIESLMSYVKLKVPASQPAGFAGKMVHRFVLTRNHSKAHHPRLFMNESSVSTLNFSAATGARMGVSDGLEIQRLTSPLEACQPFIDNFVFRLSSLEPSSVDAGGQILEAIRDKYAAQSAFVLRIQEHHSELRFYSESEGKDISTLDLVNIASRRIIQALEEKKFHPGSAGIFHRFPALKGADRAGSMPGVMIIPLKIGRVSDFMVIFGTTKDEFIGEIYAHILKALYFATSEFAVLPIGLDSAIPSALKLESVILDELRAVYGYLPYTMYERRFHLFRQSLDATTVAFEPILYLDPVNLYIWGWECLAREGEGDHAPVHLFKSAELWGPRFMVEMDMHFINLATHRYRELLTRHGIRRGHELNLSVNVYPASLMRSAYRKAVQKIIQEEKVILGEKLVMEISEKLPIVVDTPMSESKALQAFKRHITEYTSDFRINFAIDDFGVGYSSVSRLANLDPYYVKIDRDILLQKDFCELTLRYVKQMVDINKISHPVVVIEGFDGTTDMAVSLKRLYDDGIRYVQGYIIGRAGPDLYDLSDEVERFLKKELD